MHFDPDVLVFLSAAIDTRLYFFNYSLDYYIRLRDFDEGIYFPDNCCYKIA